MTFNVSTNKVQLDSTGIYGCTSNHKKEPSSQLLHTCNTPDGKMSFYYFEVAISTETKSQRNFDITFIYFGCTRAPMDNSLPFEFPSVGHD